MSEQTDIRNILLHEIRNMSDEEWQAVEDSLDAAQNQAPDAYDGAEPKDTNWR